MVHHPDTVKVIAFWGGRRRCQYRRQRGRRVPFQYHVPGWDAEYASQMLEEILKGEATVDKGVECDTVIVNANWQDDGHVRDGSAVHPEDVPWLVKQQQRLEDAHESKTKNGTLRVITRENIGLSFGSFNHAYTNLRGIYKWWFFTEDDYLFLRPGYILDSIIEMANHDSLGFLAHKRGHRVKRKLYAPGGIGLGRAEALADAFARNRNKRHPHGHLPYYHAKGYEKQIELGEIRFTESIVRAGWDLRYVDEHVWTHWTEIGAPPCQK